MDHNTLAAVGIVAYLVFILLIPVSIGIAIRIAKRH